MKEDKDTPDLLFVAAEDKRISVYAKSPRVGQPDAENNEEQGSSAQEFEYKIVAELVGHANRLA